jgi:hypothetical protein
VWEESRGERRRDTRVVASLTGDKGDNGAPTDFIEEGAASGAQSGLKASAEGGGSSRARWSGVRRSGVAKKLKGRRGGGPVASQAAGSDRLGHMERGNLGARVAAWGVRGGFGKRGRERGGWPVGQPTG